MHGAFLVSKNYLKTDNIHQTAAETLLHSVMCPAEFFGDNTGGENTEFFGDNTGGDNTGGDNTGGCGCEAKRLIRRRALEKLIMSPQ